MDFRFQMQMIFDRMYFRFDELCESWTYFSFGKNQFFERSEVKPQVGEAETNVGVSQNDAGHVFDDVDTDDVTRDDITGKSTTKTEHEPEVGPEVESEMDEEVEKYVKMIRIGIPVGAVENKMKLDNVDPVKLQPYL